jgi:hypothetical protein
VEPSNQKVENHDEDDDEEEVLDVMEPKIRYGVMSHDPLPFDSTVKKSRWHPPHFPFWDTIMVDTGDKSAYLAS